jgi:hypothetical protein
MLNKRLLRRFFYDRGNCKFNSVVVEFAALKNWGRELMVFKPRIALYYGEL